jgi:hypothetical protein
MKIAALIRGGDFRSVAVLMAVRFDWETNTK